MTQEEVAALLVARGWAYRLPLRPKNPHGEWERCTRSITLLSVNPCPCRRIARTPARSSTSPRPARFLSGHTRKEARPVGPQTRRRMLGG